MNYLEVGLIALVGRQKVAAMGTGHLYTAMMVPLLGQEGGED